MLFAECMISLGIADGGSSNSATPLHLLEGVVKPTFLLPFPARGLSRGSRGSFTVQGRSRRGMQRAGGQGRRRSVAGVCSEGRE